MQKWEYKLLRKRKVQAESILNVLGEQGWELIHVESHWINSEEQWDIVYHFKRPIELLTTAPEGPQI